MIADFPDRLPRGNGRHCGRFIAEHLRAVMDRDCRFADVFVFCGLAVILETAPAVYAVNENVAKFSLPLHSIFKKLLQTASIFQSQATLCSVRICFDNTENVARGWPRNDTECRPWQSRTRTGAAGLRWTDFMLELMLICAGGD